jgi:hypothetical protein
LPVPDYRGDIELLLQPATQLVGDARVILGEYDSRAAVKLQVGAPHDRRGQVHP